MTPAALAPLLLMQSATDPTAAVHHAIDAVLAGASAAEAQQALEEWVALQGAQVQQMFTGPARRDCCTGVERDHGALAASMGRHPSGRDLPPYTHKPITTAGGLRVVGWSEPVPVVDDGPDHIAPSDRCTECGGWGGWTETNRFGDDIDSPCHHCGETGVEP